MLVCEFTEWVRPQLTQRQYHILLNYLEPKEGEDLHITRSTEARQEGIHPGSLSFTRKKVERYATLFEVYVVSEMDEEV